MQSVSKSPALSSCEYNILVFNPTLPAWECYQVFMWNQNQAKLVMLSRCSYLMTFLNVPDIVYQVHNIPNSIPPPIPRPEGMPLP